jgi:hypothetical protein
MYGKGTIVDSGAGRSIISSKFFEQLRQAGVGFHFSTNVDVNLFLHQREKTCVRWHDHDRDARRGRAAT